jgi:translation elongation factor EF-Ts
MKIDLNKVRLLRDKTSAPVLLIKEALQTCNNDIVDAEVFINKNWHSTDRIISFRTIYSYVHQG